jgi:hypothetical protein
MPYFEPEHKPWRGSSPGRASNSHSLKTGSAHGDVLALLEFRSLEDEYRPNVRPGSPAHGDVLALLEFRSLEDEYRPNVRQGTNDWDVPV